METAPVKIELSTDLDAIGQMNAADVFEGNKLDPLLALIESEVTAEVTETDTVKGRERIGSLAYQVARTKTTLDGLGKDLVAGRKAEIAAIDQRRREARDFLDALKQKVREPLDKWEAEEQARIDKLEARLQQIHELALLDPEKTANDLRFDIDKLKAIEIGEDWQEYQGQAMSARDAALVALYEEIPKRQQAEDDAAELKARREQEAREAQERRDAEIAERAAREERERIEREQAAAEERERKQREQAEAEERREREEQEARERNTRYKGACNKEAAAAIEKIGVNEEIAQNIVRAIAAGKIPRVTINY